MTAQTSQRRAHDHRALLKAIRVRYGLSAARISCLLGIDPSGRMVRRYQSGQIVITEPIAELLRYIEKYGPLPAAFLKPDSPKGPTGQLLRYIEKYGPLR